MLHQNLVGPGGVWEAPAVGAGAAAWSAPSPRIPPGLVPMGQGGTGFRIRAGRPPPFGVLAGGGGGSTEIGQANRGAPGILHFPSLSLSLWQSLSSPMGICCDSVYPHTPQSLSVSVSAYYCALIHPHRRGARRGAAWGPRIIHLQMLTGSPEAPWGVNPQDRNLQRLPNLPAAGTCTTSKDKGRGRRQRARETKVWGLPLSFPSSRVRVALFTS